MGHKKGRSKAETIEVKIERRCSSKEQGDYRKQLRREKLNGNSDDAFFPRELLLRSVLRRLQIVAKLNIVTHARARTLYTRSINGQPRRTNMYTRAERNLSFKVFTEARIHNWIEGNIQKTRVLNFS